MRYAILSDIHANLEALHAVLADAHGRAEGLLCLGYGADPEACVDLVGERADVVVGGNHEWAVGGRLDLGWFNRHARAAAEWTRDRMDGDHLGWLASRPLTAEVADATLVHASPDHPDEWDYLVAAEDGWDAFPAFTTRLCFVGHSHRPAVWSLGSSGPDCYIVNVGSVGQPRDRDPRAAYAVWDVEAGKVSIRRVPYDIAAARLKIERAGLPRFLSDRLAAGT